MAAGLPPPLSALHAELTVSWAAGMVNVLTLGGGGGSGGMEGVGEERLRLRLTQVTLGWRAGGEGGGGNELTALVNRGSQKGKDRLHSFLSLSLFFKSPQRITI